MNQNYKEMKIKVYCESTRSGIMGTGGTETTETEFVAEFEAESREKAIEEFKNFFLTKDRTFHIYSNGKAEIEWKNPADHQPYQRTLITKTWYINI